MRGPSQHKYVQLFGRRPNDARICPESPVNRRPRYCETCGRFMEDSGLLPDIQIREDRDSIREANKITLYVPKAGSQATTYVNVMTERVLAALQNAIPEVPLHIGKVLDDKGIPMSGLASVVVPQSHQIARRAPETNEENRCRDCNWNKGQIFYLGTELVSFLAMEDIADRRLVSNGLWIYCRKDAIADILSDRTFGVVASRVPVWPADTTYDDPWVHAYHEYLVRGRAAEAKTKKFQKEMDSD